MFSAAQAGPSMYSATCPYSTVSTVSAMPAAMRYDRKVFASGRAVKLDATCNARVCTLEDSCWVAASIMGTERQVTSQSACQGRRKRRQPWLDYSPYRLLARGVSYPARFKHLATCRWLAPRLLLSKWFNMRGAR